jgi:hypothetical protein
MCYVGGVRSSDTDVEMHFYLGDFGLFVPRLPLTGKPYDVEFDYTARDGAIHMMENGKLVEHTAVIAAKGWIKATDVIRSEYRGTDYYSPVYECHLQFDCEWGGGQTLTATVTKCSFLAGMLVDFVGYGDYVWANGSDHKVAISMGRYRGNDIAYAEYDGEFKDEEIQPGESFEWEDTGFISSHPEYAFDAIKVLFDDTYEMEYILRNQWDMNHIPYEIYDRNCDPTLSANYKQEELHRFPPARTCWTYTFTEADYDAAVACDNYLNTK